MGMISLERLLLLRKNMVATLGGRQQKENILRKSKCNGFKIRGFGGFGGEDAGARKSIFPSRGSFCTDQQTNKLPEAPHY
jgi:hypothetical protein